ncbi:hypothetical protein PR202_gb08497 [Eleusine coracana subsp. coracana]|uniref:SCP domain-containing protein n=1 Tax=Eleusine coracana subsp. coracana TaxID=191504 RepID=A0AAV5EF16_ELECO|nr:hypothetical protein PR202_gb08497 [Eleusine coracana subsp. coracana]
MAAALLVLLLAVAATGSVDAQDSAAGNQAFLDLHNLARADVGVAPLVWDDTVASYAERYAATRQRDCQLQRSNGSYGENIFWGSGGKNWTATDAVAAWVEEKQYYDCSLNSCASGRVCKHYTQAVWADTVRLGCAAVTCDGAAGTFIICNYDPAGNVPGRRPYHDCGFNRSAQVAPQDFLNPQNVARGMLGIGMLSWDSSVAAYAQGYAEKRMRDCMKINSGGPYGENIFQGTSSTASEAVFSWLGQNRNYNCTSNTCATGQTCDDYTQLMWANSKKVGCASVACADGGTFITCNYDPQATSLVSGHTYPVCKLEVLVLHQFLIIPCGNSFKLDHLIAFREVLIRNALTLATILIGSEDIEDIKSLLLDPSVIRAATDNFAEGNKLGEGGFGQVYKVWDKWTSGTITEIIDPSLRCNCDENVVLKCIHIGLLCVQENPTDRPSMSNVILMLVGRSTTLPAPRPAFLFRMDDVNNSHHEAGNDLVRQSDKSKASLNKVTITELAPR